MRASDRADRELAGQSNGYRQNFFVRYGQWLGVVPKQPNIDPATGKPMPRFSFCDEPAEPLFRRHAAGRFRLLDQVQDDGRRRSCSRRSARPAS